MNFLPKEIEDIIVDYKNQLEYTEKYDKVIGELNNTLKHYSIKNDIVYLITEKRPNDFTIAKDIIRIDRDELRVLDKRIRYRNIIKPYNKEKNIRLSIMERARYLV